MTWKLRLDHIVAKVNGRWILGQNRRSLNYLNKISRLSKSIEKCQLQCTWKEKSTGELCLKMFQSVNHANSSTQTTKLSKLIKCKFDKWIPWNRSL